MPIAVDLPRARIQTLLRHARQRHILVVGDVMLDQFIWGHVSRISPEAPVPVVEFARESFMPGGSANVARNLSALGAQVHLHSVLGKDDAARKLRHLLTADKVDCAGVRATKRRSTSIKTRIVAHQQQVVRLDRETRQDLDAANTRRLVHDLESAVRTAHAVIVGDYGKGIVTQPLLDLLKEQCRARGLWLSVDPKPVHQLDLTGLSLITPNRKEAFEMAGMEDSQRHENPLLDPGLNRVARFILKHLAPALLLITLGDQGMLLCQPGKAPLHIPTAAREVFDVSGAGDTVIASFTLAIAAGATPHEAAIFSNRAAGVVVGKVGTATVQPAELLDRFKGVNAPR